MIRDEFRVVGPKSPWTWTLSINLHVEEEERERKRLGCALMFLTGPTVILSMARPMRGETVPGRTKLLGFAVLGCTAWEGPRQYSDPEAAPLFP